MHVNQEGMGCFVLFQWICWMVLFYNRKDLRLIEVWSFKLKLPLQLWCWIHQLLVLAFLYLEMTLYEVSEKCQYQLLKFHWRFQLSAPPQRRNSSSRSSGASPWQELAVCSMLCSHLSDRVVKRDLPVGHKVPVFPWTSLLPGTAEKPGNWDTGAGLEPRSCSQSPACLFTKAPILWATLHQGSGLFQPWRVTPGHGWLLQFHEHLQSSCEASLHFHS